MTNLKSPNFLIGIGMILAMTSCDHDTELQIQNPHEPIDATTDIVSGKLIHVIDFEGQNKIRIPINSNGNFDIEIHDNVNMSFSKIIEGDNAYIEIEKPINSNQKLAIAPVKVTPHGYPEKARTLIIVGRNFQNTSSRAESSARQPGEALFSVYSEYLGKGTVCFNDIGNHKGSVIFSPFLTKPM